MIVKHYSILEDELNSKPFEEGSIYLTSDTNRIYVDLEGKESHTLISADPIIITTEIERQNLLTPINDKAYFVLESKKFYIYNNGSWYTNEITIDNELSETSNNPISNKAVYTAINDLREELSNGSIDQNVPILNENYPIDVNFKYNESGYILSVIVNQYAFNCTYQWYKDNQPINGATSSTYNFIPDDIYATYNIFCIVSNSLGSVISRTAIINVYPSEFYIVKDGVVDTRVNVYGGEYTLAGKLVIRAVVDQLTTSEIPTSIYNTVSIKCYISYTSCTTDLLQIGDKIFTANLVQNSAKVFNFDISGIKTDEDVTVLFNQEKMGIIYIYII